MTSNRPILVTGSHRSGTTWAGEMISASSQVAYIHEPFNRDDHPGAGVFNKRFDIWFPYITPENLVDIYESYRKTLEFRFDYLAALRSIRSVPDIQIVFSSAKRFSGFKSRNLRPLVKDPIAIFSAESLASSFNMSVLVMIRHPAAFVSSLKNLKWTFPFEHFLRQPLLMRDHLHPFEMEIRDFSANRKETLDQAILLWKVIHHVILKYQANHPDWIFMRHEDLSREPMVNFGDIFKKLDLDFTHHVKRVIQEHTEASNPAEVAADCIKRDSKTNIWNWKKRLTQDEILHIRRQIGNLSDNLYSDSEW